MAGRVTLINSVLASVPVFSLKAIPLPLSVSKAIDKVNMNFLWGHTTNKKAHLISCGCITKPKRYGDLGICQTHKANLAFFISTVWCLWCNPYSLWASVLKAKYFPSTDIWNAQSHPHQSPTWKFILRARDEILKHVAWINSGNFLSLWYDKWCLGTSLREHFVGPLPEDWDCMRVADIISPNRNWDLSLFSHSFPQSLVDLIFSIPLNPIGRGKDIPVWRTTSGYCTSKSAYGALSSEVQDVDKKWN